MPAHEEKQEQAGQQKPLFAEHFQAFVQEVGRSRARNIEDFGNALIGKVLVEFQMDHFLLPGRERLDNMLNAGKLFCRKLGENELAFDGIGCFVEILGRIVDRQKNFRAVSTLEYTVSEAGQQVRFDVVGFAERFPAFPQMQEKVMHQVFQMIAVTHETPSVIEQWPVIVAQELLEGKRVALPELLPKYRILFHEKWVTSGANVPFFFIGKNPARTTAII